VPKPKKPRFVREPPSVAFFKPQGIPLFQLEQVVLGVDEFEAIRLVDYEGLHLEDEAERLQVSRATCARILDSAHKKIGTALTHGHAIRIEGGTFVLGRNRFRCRECGGRWDMELGKGAPGGQGASCPQCQSDRVVDMGKEVGFRGEDAVPPNGPPPDAPARGGRGWRGGRSRG
jgi:uncharacterized protein